MHGIGSLNEALAIREDANGPYFVLYPADEDASHAYWGVHYPVVIEECDEAFTASVPALPGLVAKAEGRDEVKGKLAEAIKAYIGRTMPLIAEYIVENGPYHGDGNAWVDGVGVAVWALIGHLEAVHADIEQTAKDYEIPRQAVEAARAYYLLNKPIIDARRAANRARGIA